MAGILNANAAQSFFPGSLFASNEPGVWYDPSDMATLFQDSAGTTPVTAVEQPVGLVLDKRKGSVGTNGAKRVNRLSWSEAFDNAVWFKFQVNAANTTDTTDPLGGNTADTILESTANSTHVIEWRGSQSVSQVSDNYTFSVALKGNGRSELFVGCYQNTGSFPSFGATFDLSSVTFTSSASGTGVFVSASITSLGNGWYRCVVTGRTGAATVNNFQIGPPGSYPGDVTKGFYIWGADLRLASEASTLPTYQRIDADWPSTMAGNHASQSTSTARPVLSARVNALVHTEAFDNAAWTKVDATITANAAIAPDATTTADKLVEAATTAEHAVFQSPSYVSGVSYTFSIAAKSVERSFVYLQLGSAAFGTATGAWFNLTTGLVGSTANSPTTSITALGDGWYRCSITKTATSSSTAATVIETAATDGVKSYTGDGTSGIYIWGADLRVANDGVGIPSYQRVGAGTAGSSSASGSADYDTAGFPLYLKFDGTDDFLNILGSASAMKFLHSSVSSVSAGVRFGNSSNPDAAYTLFGSNGTSITNVGAAFFYDDRESVTRNNSAVGLIANGSAGNPTVLTPDNDKITPNSQQIIYYNADPANGTAASRYSLYVNGVGPTATNTSTTPLSTANSTYDVQIGAHGNSSLFAVMRLYSFVMVNSTLSTAARNNLTQWVNSKTRAF
jgi:hypothetical protein